MIKRILTITLCTIMLMSVVSFGAYQDVDDSSMYGKAIEALSSAGILSGYGNGTFGSKDPLTRAQFAKIVVMISGQEDGAKSKTNEVFTDVSSSHWAIGYINEAANLGLITGYPDGSFGADEKITYAQALTIIIRMLGYTESEVGNNWPVDYINKAAELGITNGIRFGRNEYLTREVAAYLIYNSLTAKNGSGAIAQTVKKVEDVVIYGVNSINSGIAEDEVLTSGGIFKKGHGYNDELLGKKVTLRVNLDNEIIMAIPENQSCVVYTAVSGEGDELETIENGTVKINFGSKVYYKGSETTFTAISSSVTAGSKVYKYSDYIYIEYIEKEKNDEKEKDYSGIYDSFGDVIKKYEDVVIYGDNSVNAGIAKDEVITTAGTFKKGTAYKSSYLGRRVEIRVNQDNEIVLITPDVQNATVYTALLGSNDELKTVENGTVKVKMLSTVYYKGKKSTFMEEGPSISFGSKVYMYDDYIYIEEKADDELLEDEEIIKKAFGSEDAAIDFEWLENSSGEILAKYEDIIIYGVNRINSSVPADYVMTTSGLLKKGNVFDENYLGRRVELMVNAKDGIIAIIPEDEAAEGYTLLSAYADKIETKENGVKDIDGKIPVYYKGSSATYNDIYSNVTPGSKVYIYEDYIYIEENELIGPFTVTGDYNQIYDFFGDIRNAGVTIDGETAAVSDIEKYDVVYYNDKTDRIYAYSEKVTGIYDKALPSKSNLTGIILSGTTYSEISADARKKLDDTLGAFKINDRITLLFGHDGKVVDVVDIDGKTLDDMGVVLKTYSKISTEEEYKGKNEFFADIMLASGKTVTYKTDKEYKDILYEIYIGKFVYIINSGNGKVKLEPASENKLTGSFDKSVPSYAGCKLQQNYSILECVYSERYDEAVVRKVNLKDISLSALTSRDIIHVEYANSLNDIAVIYVNNITYDGYTFGVLNKAIKDEDANYTYELKSSAGTTTYTGSAGWDFVKGEAVMVLTKNLQIMVIKELTEVAAVTKIEDYTDTRIKVNGKVYDMDKDVSVVYKHIGDTDWNITTIKDFEENVESGTWKVGSVGIYADKKTDGKVRVIRITLK
ncbi:MAG: S-layer homology domain-containing protein [Clostridia bacterium]|nr:S-layer homology domain-containing protein [Clostridia bacterium]